MIDVFRMVLALCIVITIVGLICIDEWMNDV